MALRPSLRDALVRGAILATWLCWAGPVAAQSSTPPSGPLTPPAATLPDLVVTKVSVIAGCQNNTVTATISTQVKNQGPVAADLTNVPWQIIVEVTWGTNGLAQLESRNTQTIKPQQGLPKKTLAPGAVFDTTMVIKGIPRFKAGGFKNPQYSYTVRADPLKGVAEGNENNNEKMAYSNSICDLAP